MVKIAIDLWTTEIVARAAEKRTMNEKNAVGDRLVTQRCNHENIATLHAVTNLESEKYESGLIMGFFRGGDLSRAVAADTNQLVSYALQAARGAAHMHENNLAYRDFKPENMTVEDGILKIFDFGTVISDEQIAKVKDIKRITRDMSGTPLYKPPECLTSNWNNPVSDYERKNPLEFIQKGDVYALGVSLIELRTPNLGNEEDVRGDNLEAAVAALKSSTDSTDPITRLIQKMLDDDPSSRPTMQDIVMFFENLEDFDSQENVDSFFDSRSNFRSSLNTLNELQIAGMKLTEEFSAIRHLKLLVVPNSKTVKDHVAALVNDLKMANQLDPPFSKFRDNSINDTDKRHLSNLHNFLEENTEYFQQSLIDLIQSKKAKSENKVHLSDVLIKAMNNLDTHSNDNLVKLIDFVITEFSALAGGQKKLNIAEVKLLLKDPRVQKYPRILQGLMDGFKDHQLRAIRNEQYVIASMLLKNVSKDRDLLNTIYDAIKDFGGDTNLDLKGIYSIVQQVISQLNLDLDITSLKELTKEKITSMKPFGVKNYNDFESALKSYQEVTALINEVQGVEPS